MSLLFRKEQSRWEGINKHHHWFKPKANLSGNFIESSKVTTEGEHKLDNIKEHCSEHDQKSLLLVSVKFVTIWE